jgi:hypothetical protein
MPLARYFLLVGGSLFVLLLIAAALLPPLPVAERVDTHRKEIRIHSEQKRRNAWCSIQNAPRLLIPTRL